MNKKEIKTYIAFITFISIIAIIAMAIIVYYPDREIQKRITNNLLNGVITVYGILLICALRWEYARNKIRTIKRHSYVVSKTLCSMLVCLLLIKLF